MIMRKQWLLIRRELAVLSTFRRHPSLSTMYSIRHEWGVDCDNIGIVASNNKIPAL